MSGFREWLRRIGPRIAIHFHGPVTFNLFAGKRGKDRGTPTLLADPQPQVQRRRLLQINLAPERRAIEPPTPAYIRESWRAATDELSQLNSKRR